MIKLFVGNLPQEISELELTNIFSEFGKVRGIKLVMDVFTNKCKGFGFIEMEGHEARAAMKALNGKSISGKNITVKFEEPKGKRKKY